VSPRVRVVVERTFSPHCGLAVWDCFEVEETRLSLPQGKPFCAYAMQATFTLIDARMGDLPEGHWLERKPTVCCPDPTDGVILRLERVE
jgi:uncharacterized repeat protein (TIGR04076 family)